MGHSPTTLPPQALPPQHAPRHLPGMIVATRSRTASMVFNAAGAATISFIHSKLRISGDELHRGASAFGP